MGIRPNMEEVRDYYESRAGDADKMESELTALRAEVAPLRERLAITACYAFVVMLPCPVM